MSEFAGIIQTIDIFLTIAALLIASGLLIGGIFEWLWIPLLVVIFAGFNAVALNMDE